MTVGTAAPPARGNGVPAPAGKAQVPATISSVSKSITDMVESSVSRMVTSGTLKMPRNYAYDNALKAAYLALQQVEDKDHNPALSVCTRESIANALLDMVVQGLNPSKRQCYFIVFAKKLVLMRSYMGAMAVAQMVKPEIADWGYAVVYEGDTFKYRILKGKKEVIDHVQDIDNVDKAKIRAAYCIALDKNGNSVRTEIATIDEIHQAWKQSRNNPFDDKGNVKESSTHGKFASEMALKTVINKTCKIIINSSSDSTLLLETFNKTHELVDAAEVQAEIAEHANTGETLMIPEETATGEAQSEVADHESAPEKPEDAKHEPAGHAGRKPGF